MKIRPLICDPEHYPEDAKYAAPKKGNKYSASISYESDFKPVRTVKVEFESTSPKAGLRQATREAIKAWPKQEQFRSWVICVEKL